MTALNEVNENISKAAALAGRKPDDITLIAISKTRSAEDIRSLLEAGHRVFGENRVQETAEKWPTLRDEYADAKIHLVGQLQSNKAEEAVEHFDVIHSLDRPSLVKELAKAMEKADRKVPCFIQVNIGEESQKGGCEIANVPGLLKSALDLGIPVLGLMCLPPSDINPAPYFALLAKIAKDSALSGLSMGMSGDYEAAIKLGATHVRVGTALFGARNS